MSGGVDLWELENAVRGEGYGVVCGVDEAGRGPLAGPVCAAAVILPRGPRDRGLERLQEAHRKAARVALRGDHLLPPKPTASPSQAVEEIEKLNILGATYLAMNRAIAAPGA